MLPPELPAGKTVGLARRRLIAASVGVRTGVGLGVREQMNAEPDAR